MSTTDPRIVAEARRFIEETYANGFDITSQELTRWKKASRQSPMDRSSNDAS